VVLDRDEFHLPAAGATFAGRDVFAPVAAHLCNGVDLADLGTPIDPALLLPSVVPLPRTEQGVLVCEIMWIDNFGNAQLNVGPSDLDDTWGPGWGDRVRVQVGEHIRSMPVVAAFADLSSSAPGLVLDSYGMLAIAIDRYSAAAELGLGVTEQVILRPTAEIDAPSTPVRLRIER
jgi:S-adenosylmethionine hydrolase